MVRPFPQGWSLTGPTGKGTVARTFDELMDSCSTHSPVTGWEEIDAALNSSQPDPYPEAHPEYRPPALGRGNFPDKPSYVLEGNPEAPTHLRMAAFGLGIRCLDPGTVVLDVRRRRLPFTLVAKKGVITAILHN